MSIEKKILLTISDLSIIVDLCTVKWIAVHKDTISIETNINSKIKINNCCSNNQ